MSDEVLESKRTDGQGVTSHAQITFLHKSCEHKEDLVFTDNLLVWGMIYLIETYSRLMEWKWFWCHHKFFQYFFWFWIVEILFSKLKWKELSKESDPWSIEACNGFFE